MLIKHGLLRLQVPSLPQDAIGFIRPYQGSSIQTVFRKCVVSRLEDSAISVIILRYILLNEKFGFFYADCVSPILRKFHYFRDCGPKIVKPVLGHREHKFHTWNKKTAMNMFSENKKNIKSYLCLNLKIPF